MECLGPTPEGGSSQEVSDLAKRLHAAADETTEAGTADAQDHDELHAAGAVLEMLTGGEPNPAYIWRWIDGLAERVAKK